MQTLYPQPTEVQDIPGQAFMFDSVPASGHRVLADHADAELHRTDEDSEAEHASWADGVTIHEVPGMIRQRLPKLVGRYTYGESLHGSSYEGLVRRSCVITLLDRGGREVRGDNWPDAIGRLVGVCVGN